MNSIVNKRDGVTNVKYMYINTQIHYHMQYNTHATYSNKFHLKETPTPSGNKDKSTKMMIYSLKVRLVGGSLIISSNSYS